MTNINCSAECKYQKDGKCSYEGTAAKSFNLAEGCAYFQSKAKNIRDDN